MNTSFCLIKTPERAKTLVKNNTIQRFMVHSYGPSSTSVRITVETIQHSRQNIFKANIDVELLSNQKDRQKTVDYVGL